MKDISVSDGAEGHAPLEAASAIYPCSYTQRRIHYAQQLDPGSSHWNVAMRWMLTGRIKPEAVQRAWELLAERHEALRTAIDESEGEPRQRVFAAAPIKVSVIDLTALAADARAAKAEDIAREDALSPIPLNADAPPLRLHLLLMGSDKAYLLTNFHNIIVDGWSVGVLIREFGEILSALTAGRGPLLSPPSLQHVDYTLWQADMVASGGFAEDRAFWKEKLADCPRFEIPADKLRAPVLTHNGEIRTLLLPPALSEKINAFAGKSGFSVFNASSAALCATLAGAAGHYDVVMGTQAACRDEPELETMVGPLINTTVLRFDATGDPTLAELLGRARKTCVDALSHQQTPFNFVVEDLRPNRDPSRNLVYSITFTAQAAHIDSGRMTDLAFDGLVIAAMPSFPAGAPTELGFFMVGREEGWRVSCAANTDLFELATVDCLLKRWAQALEALIERGETTRLSELAALPEPAYAPTGIAAAETPKAAAHATPEADSRADLSPWAEEITSIWAEALGAPVDPETDFFDAGGTSLTALRMVARVNRATGQRLALTTLLKNPKLGEFLKGGAARTAPVADGKTRIMALNNGYAYLLIERGMTDTHAIVDIPVGDADDLEFARTGSLHDIVARVTARVIEASPAGPYILMAYCRTGVVALEVARQLAAQGRAVQAIVMLNAVAPNYRSDMSWKARAVRRAAQIREAAEHFGTLIAMRRRREITWGAFLKHYGFARKLRIAEALQRFGLIGETPPHNDYVSALEYFDHFDRARAEAATGGEPVRADIIMCRTRDMLRGSVFPPLYGWPRCVSGRVQVIDVDGKHTEMLRDPAASDIARKVAAALQPYAGCEAPNAAPKAAHQAPASAKPAGIKNAARMLVKAAVTQTPLGPLLGKTPLATLYRRRIWRGGMNLFDGAYSTHAEAERSLQPRNEGWNDAALADALALHRPSRTTESGLPVLVSQTSAYAVLLWLSKLMKPGVRVVDVGGAGGVLYWWFRAFFDMPEGAHWTVVDTPAMLTRGRELATREGAGDLSFEGALNAAAPCDILLSSGCLQYMAPRQFDEFVRYAANASAVIINKAALTDGAEFWTTQSLGAASSAYWIANRDAFVAAFTRLGFDLADAWTAPELSVEIPFAPSRRVESLSGLVFLAPRETAPDA
jgi:putative methyltransferase (TIGR04325 family)